MKAFSKVPSGALQFAVFVSAVIAFLLLAFLLLVHTQQKIGLRSQKDLQLIEATNRGFRYVQHNTTTAKDTFDIEILDQKNIQLRAHVSPWGVYQKTFVDAQWDNHNFSKIGLIGGGLSMDNRKAIILTEMYKPLLLVGKTKITGDVVLSEQGVRSGVISGQTFFGSQLVYGRRGVAKKELPRLAMDFSKTINNYLTQYPQSTNDFVPESDYQLAYQSFRLPTQWLYDSETIYLDQNNLKGNIIIRSEREIIVSPQTNLQDVLLIAPKVTIQDEVTGNFQTLATQSIYVGKNCTLAYPSALVLTQKQVSQFRSQSKPNQKVIDNAIVVDESSVVKGVVCYLNSDSKIGYTNNIIFKEASKLIGEVYCQGNLELNGTVIGSVYANQFGLNYYGSIYMNHLYNVTINAKELPEAFAGIPLDQSSKNIVQWLY